MRRTRDAESLLKLAHELRTPLTSLSLAAGVLSDVGPLNDAQRGVVDQIETDLDRLRRLVDATLQTERLGPYSGRIARRRVPLDTLVRRAVGPLAPQARERGIALVLDLAPGVAVMADTTKLGWVVASLVGNALRFSPANSAVTVTVRGGDAEATLAVADAGPGMTDAACAEALDAASGKGLTLPLAREIVEAHGGALSLTSAPGEGTRVTVALTAVPPAKAPST